MCFFHFIPCGICCFHCNLIFGGICEIELSTCIIRCACRYISNIHCLTVFGNRPFHFGRTDIFCCQSGCNIFSCLAIIRHTQLQLCRLKYRNCMRRGSSSAIAICYQCLNYILAGEREIELTSCFIRCFCCYISNINRFTVFFYCPFDIFITEVICNNACSNICAFFNGIRHININRSSCKNCNGMGFCYFFAALIITGYGNGVFTCILKNKSTACLSGCFLCYFAQRNGCTILFHCPVNITEIFGCKRCRYLIQGIRRILHSNLQLSCRIDCDLLILNRHAAAFISYNRFNGICTGFSESECTADIIGCAYGYAVQRNILIILFNCPSYTVHSKVFSFQACLYFLAGCRLFRQC